MHVRRKAVAKRLVLSFSVALTVLLGMGVAAYAQEEGAQAA